MKCIISCLMMLTLCSRSLVDFFSLLTTRFSLPQSSSRLSMVSLSSRVKSRMREYLETVSRLRTMLSGQDAWYVRLRPGIPIFLSDTWSRRKVRFLENGSADAVTELLMAVSRTLLSDAGKLNEYNMSTNQRTAFNWGNQSKISIVMCQPIRSKYLPGDSRWGGAEPDMRWEWSWPARLAGWSMLWPSWHRDITRCRPNSPRTQ